MEAEAFVEEVLRGTLGAREVVVGFNHTFGRGARGTAMLLKEMGDRQGFTVHVLPPLEVSGQIVSSSAIREALRDGDVELTRALLGRPYLVRGRVLAGCGPGTDSRVPDRQPPARPPAHPGARRLRGPCRLGRRATRCRRQCRIPADVRRGAVLDRGVRVRFRGRSVRSRAQRRLPSAHPRGDEVRAGSRRSSGRSRWTWRRPDGCSPRTAVDAARTSRHRFDSRRRRVT